MALSDQSTFFGATSADESSSFTQPVLKEKHVRCLGNLVRTKPKKTHTHTQTERSRARRLIDYTCILWKGSPVAWSMELNEVGELEIFLWSPWTFLETILVTTRSSSHWSRYLEQVGYGCKGAWSIRRGKSVLSVDPNGCGRPSYI